MIFAFVSLSWKVSIVIIMESLYHHHHGKYPILDSNIPPSPWRQYISFVHPKYCCSAIMAPLYYTKQPFVVQHTLNSLFTLTNINTFLVKFLSFDLWDRRIAWISSLRLKVLWKVVCVKFWGGIWSQEYKKVGLIRTTIWCGLDIVRTTCGAD